MFKSLFCAILVASAVSPASAKDDGDPVRVVHYSDLNLQTSRGVDQLDRRVAAAISEMCGTSENRDLGALNQEQACRTASLASVASQRTTAIAAAKGDRATLLATR